MSGPREPRRSSGDGLGDYATLAAPQTNPQTRAISSSPPKLRQTAHSRHNSELTPHLSQSSISTSATSASASASVSDPRVAELKEYLFRAAVLHHRTEPRFLAAAEADRSARSAGRSSFVSFNSADPTSLRLPPRWFAHVTPGIEAIITRSDPTRKHIYNNGPLRETFKLFYNRCLQLTAPQLELNAGAETLAMMFISCGRAALRSGQSGQSGDTNSDKSTETVLLSSFAAAFFRFLADVYESKNKRKYEKLAENLRAAVAPDGQSLLIPGTDGNNASVARPHFQIRDMRLLQTVDELFCGQIQLDMKRLKDCATPDTYCADLGKMREALVADKWGGVAITAFGDILAYRVAKQMALRNIEAQLAVYKRFCVNQRAALAGTDSALYFVPENSTDLYSLLCDLCFRQKLRADSGKNGGSTSEAMPERFLDLLRFVREIWHILPSTSETRFIASAYNEAFRVEVNSSVDVLTGFSRISAIYATIPKLCGPNEPSEPPPEFPDWPESDQELHKRNLLHLFYRLTKTIRLRLRGLFRNDIRSSEIDSANGIFRSVIISDPVWPEIESEAESRGFVTKIARQVNVAAIGMYNSLRAELSGGKLTVAQVDEFLVKVFAEFDSVANRIKPRVFGLFSVSDIVVVRIVPYLFRDIYAMLKAVENVETNAETMAEESEKPENISATLQWEELKSLFFDCRTLAQKFRSVFPATAPFAEVSESDFARHFDNLLNFYFRSALKWVCGPRDSVVVSARAAAASEDLKPVDLAENLLFSASAKQFMAVVVSRVGEIEGLKWPNEPQSATLLKCRLKDVAQGVAEYVAHIDLCFNKYFIEPQMNGPESTKGIKISDARELLRRMLHRNNGNGILNGTAETEIGTTNQLQSEIFVAMNNVHFLLEQFDALEQRLKPASVDAEAEKLTRGVSGVSGVPEKGRATCFCTIVQAENLEMQGKLPCAFALLEAESSGARLGQTGVAQQSTDPVWDETCVFPLPEAETLRVRIWDRSSGGAGRFCGQGRRLIAPQELGTEPRSVWLSLTPQGRVLLLLSAEREEDSAVYYVGRSFRLLVQAEQRMADRVVAQFRGDIRRVVNSESVAQVAQSTKREVPLLKTFVLSLNLGTESGNDTEELDSATVADSTIITKVAQFIEPLLTHVTLNFIVMSKYLADGLYHRVVLAVWDAAVAALVASAVPEVHEQGIRRPPLTDRELWVVKVWRDALLELFLDGEVPETELKGRKTYRELDLVLFHYHSPVAELRAEVERSQRRRGAAGARVRSLVARRNTVFGHRNRRVRRDEERQLAEAATTVAEEDVLLRLLLLKGDEAFVRSVLRSRNR